MQLIRCSLEEFIQNENRKIVCFGGGNYFLAFIEECTNFGRDKNIIAIADNVLKGDVYFDGCVFSVVDVQELKSMVDREDIAIVITTAYYTEVEKQLKKEIGTKKIDYYIYPLMQAYTKKIEIKISGLEKEPVIPKQIHYCWFGRGKKSDKEKKYIEGWREKCPEFEIIEWNEDNYDISKCKYIQEAYEHGKWAFVSDYARLDILSKQGGFYFDTDVEILKDISDLRYHKAFVGVEAAGGIATGLGCGFVKNFPILKEIMLQYENTLFIDKNGNEILNVNANFESKIFRKYGYRKSDNFQMVGGVAVYPAEFFSPLIVGTQYLNITENTYSIHHYHYSWRK